MARQAGRLDADGARRPVAAMKSLRFLAAAIAASGSVGASGAESAGGCTLAKVDEWTLHEGLQEIVVDGQINGKKAIVLVATGLSDSLISNRAAAKFGLDRSGPRGPTLSDTSGRLATDTVVVDELRIGAISGSRVRLLKPEEDRWARRFDIALGMDILGRFETEIDWPGRRIRLFTARGCAESSLAYWSPGSATVVPFDRPARAELTVQVDGRPVRAELSTGSPFSFLDRGIAEGLGFRPDGAGVAVAGCPRAPEKGDAYMWVAPFERLVIGDEVVRHPRLRIADRPADYSELTLGSDFLNSHRVLLSPSQRRLYLTYEGGLVFPALPGQECFDLPGDGWRPPIATLDAAVARDGRDPKALLARGIARALAGEHERAVSDMDAAFRIVPGNALILVWRAHEFLAMREYDRALADYDAVLASGAQDTALHINRGNAWRAKGEVDKALDDYATAVRYEPRNPLPRAARAAMWLAKGEVEKSIADSEAVLAIDPTHRAALRSRALAAFSLGRFEEAERFLARRMGASSSPHVAIWLHVVRARGGKADAGELERLAKTLEAGKWPEPIFRFHLGRLDRDGLLAAAANPAPRVQREQLCEANFHLGQHALMSGDPRASQPWLARAAAECPPNFEESQGAKAELKRLP